MIKKIFLLLSFFVHSSCYAGSMWEEYSSVYKIRSSRNTLLMGIALTAFTREFLEHSVIDVIQQEVPEQNRLGTYNHTVDLMGQWVPNLAYSGANYLLGFLSDSDRSANFENANVMFKATAYSGLTTTILKYLIREKRPDGSTNNSFPSGHTTTAFAFAGVIGERHSLVFSIPAYLMATAVGFQRLNNNRHYFHDILMGATIGIAFGVSISKYNRNKSNLRTSILYQDNRPAGLKLSYQF